MGDYLILLNTISAVKASVLKVAEAITLSHDPSLDSLSATINDIKDLDAQLDLQRCRLSYLWPKLVGGNASEDAERYSGIPAHRQPRVLFQRLHTECIYIRSSLYKRNNLTKGDRVVLKRFVSAWGCAPENFSRADLLRKLLETEQMDKKLSNQVKVFTAILDELDVSDEMQEFRLDVENWNTRRISTYAEPVGSIISLCRTVNRTYRKLPGRSSKFCFFFEDPVEFAFPRSSTNKDFHFNLIDLVDIEQTGKASGDRYRCDWNASDINSVNSLRKTVSKTELLPQRESIVFVFRGLGWEEIIVSSKETLEQRQRRMSLYSSHAALVLAEYTAILWSTPWTLSRKDIKHLDLLNKDNLAALVDRKLDLHEFRARRFRSLAVVLAELALAQRIRIKKISNDICFEIRDQQSAPEILGRGSLLSKVRVATSASYQNAVSYCFFEENVHLQGSKRDIFEDTSFILHGDHSRDQTDDSIERFIDYVVMPLRDYHHRVKRRTESMLEFREIVLG